MSSTYASVYNAQTREWYAPRQSFTPDRSDALEAPRDLAERIARRLGEGWIVVGLDDEPEKPAQKSAAD